MGLQDWDALLAIGSIVLTAAVAFHIRVVRPFIRSFRELPEIHCKIDMLTREMSPNGGTSLKDQVTNIDQSLTIVRHHQRILHDADTHGIFECDAEGQCLYANPALAALFGLEREELLGSGWLSALPPGTRIDQWELWQDAVKHDIPYASTYEIHNKRTKKKYLVKATSHTIRDRKGRPLRFFGTISRVPESPVASMTPTELAEPRD